MNIEVKIGFDSAVELANNLVDWLQYDIESYNINRKEEKFSYKLSWDDSIDTGEDAHLQTLSIHWSKGRSEYDGSGSGEKLLVHYSPYYNENSLSRFANKASVMEGILNWIQENTENVEINHYVAVSTT